MNLINSDCLAAMATLSQNSIDTIITDPPYGLEFMGKGWDKGVPGAEYWSAMLRVAKPGASLLAFGGTRTYHRMTCAIEDAGWEIRDCMMWLYGSGFPKSHNLKGEFEGWGTALKPAWEPIIVAMKPLDGTFAQNAERHGVAGLNIDGSRIEYASDADMNGAKWGKQTGNVNDYGNGVGAMGGKDVLASSVGRWPANLILDEACAELLDEQTGILTSGSGQKSNRVKDSTCYGKMAPEMSEFAGSLGGASRFFYCAKASKSERNAGCEGMEERPNNSYGEFAGTPEHGAKLNVTKQNFHPTVKPLKLMEYLCTLTKTPTGGVVLDPFMGSGTTGVACRNTGREFIGIEKESSYFKIAQARIESAKAA